MLSILSVACGDGEDGLDHSSGCVAQSAAPPIDPSRVVVFTGDSLTARWHLPCEYVNLGVDGRDSPTISAQFDRDVLSLEPDIVALLAGTNDLLRSPVPSVDSIARMGDLAQQRGACVIVGTVPPLRPRPFASFATAVPGQAELDMRLATFNRDLIDLARSRGFLVADYHSAMRDGTGLPRATLFNQDGIHPNRSGHDAMFEVVAPLLQRCP